MKRVLTAAAGIPLAIWAVFSLSDALFLILILVVMELSIYEYVRLAQAWASKKVLGFLFVAVPIGTVLLVPWWNSQWSEWHLLGNPNMAGAIGVGVLAATAIAAATWVLYSNVNVAESMVEIGSLCFGVLYFVVPAISLCLLRKQDPRLLVLLLALVWTGDSAAYFVGSKFGKRKLAPRISPNKSWEGAFASLAGALVVALIWRQLFIQEGGLAFLALVVMTSIVAQIGDLVESMLKRGAGVKDSGSLLPGHGGMLDRFDALFFAAPVFTAGVFLTEAL